MARWRLARRYSRLRSDLELQFRKIDERVYKKHADKIDALEENFTTITDQVTEIQELISEWESEAAEVWEEISTELEERRPDLSNVEVPQSEAPGKTDRFVLFDSKRDYFTQMDSYSTWRDGDEISGGAS